MVSLSLHARECLCASPYPIYQRKSFTTTSLRLAWAWVLVFERALVFLLLSGDQGWCLQGTIWAQVAGVQRLFWLPVWQTQLWKVWRCRENCCKLSMWAYTAKVGVLGSQLFRAAGNTETGSSDLISIAFITAWQSFIKEGACQG